MEYLTEPTLPDFLLQTILYGAIVPLSYFGYRWVRAPLKRDRVKQSLTELGIVRTQELDDIVSIEYQAKNYFWPLFFATLVIIAIFISSHPYVIGNGWWAGIWEEVINIFGVDDLFPRSIVVTRFVFWGWLGAFTYSVNLIARRFLAYDLTPSVYIFVATRFWLALAIGAIVGVGMGTFLREMGVPFDANITTVSIIAFFIGFFPEQGVNWVVATAQKALKQQGGISKEKTLSEIEGLSIWHQGRLKQEGIDNVQNLAAADVTTLVISTPYPVTQIIDWIDQAILLAHTNDERFEQLENSSVIRASEVLTNTDNEEQLEAFANASGLGKDELKVLRLNLLSALNIKLVARFRWQSSIDSTKVKDAVTLQLSNTESAVEVA